MSARTPSLVLAGRLEAIALADVVQILSAAGRDGTLSIDREDPQTHAEFDFAGGQVVRAEIDRAVDSLAAVLMRREAIDLDQLGEALRRQVEYGSTVPLANILLEMGVVDAETLAAAHAELIEDRMAEAIGWQHGVFRFRLQDERRPIVASLDLGVALDPHRLLLEAARRYDEAAS